jgi:transcriptional regulator with XRE-family HTH domain
MSTKTDPAFLRAFDRQMLRAKFQSLFWNVISARKKNGKYTLQQLADALGVNKSAVSRGFSEPQNWTIDKLSDMADALGVELVIEARDKGANVTYTPVGITQPVITASKSTVTQPQYQSSNVVTQSGRPSHFGKNDGFQSIYLVAA